jgi:hypothetical protein
MATAGIIMPFVPFVARTDWGAKVVVIPASIAASGVRCQTTQHCDEV